MGPEAQAAVVKYLTHADDFVRADACKILAVIGTTDDTRVAVMDVWYRANGHGLDAMAADDTIKRIGKPQTSPFKKKATACPATRRYRSKRSRSCRDDEAGSRDESQLRAAIQDESRQNKARQERGPLATGSACPWHRDVP